MHDHNAIKVRPHGFGADEWIGYIPAKIAKDLAPILDRGSQYNCVIDNISSYRGSPRFVLQLSTFPVPISFPRAKSTSHNKSAPSTTSEDPNSPTGKKFRKHTDLDIHIENHVGVSGIYVIWSRDYKCYVGQSKNVGARWKNHRYDLLKRAHLNDRLQRAWINNGANYFRFDLLESAEPQHLDQLEHKYIQKLDSFLNGYNGTSDGQPGKAIQSNQTKPVEIVLPSSSPSLEANKPPVYNHTTEPQKKKQSIDQEAIEERNCSEDVQIDGVPISVQGVTGSCSHEIPCDHNQVRENRSGVQWVLLSLTLLFLAVAWFADSGKLPESTISPPPPPRLPPDITSPQPHGFPQWYKDHALRLRSIGRWEELIDVAGRWKDVEPENLDAWFLLGEGQLALKNFPEALAAFQQVLRLSPMHHETWKKAVETYIQAGQLKDARDITRKMEKVDPQLANEMQALLHQGSRPIRHTTK